MATDSANSKMQNKEPSAARMMVAQSGEPQRRLNENGGLRQTVQTRKWEPVSLTVLGRDGGGL